MDERKNRPGGGTGAALKNTDGRCFTIEDTAPRCGWCGTALTQPASIELGLCLTDAIRLDVVA